ncbi:MAG: hypothetical protein LDL33_06870 [Desulfomonile sp.]|nr:hypothetical protein [Desulfomonile sp.]
MSEIRSTIDLIMERTRGMTLSEKEKEEVHREELSKRARGLCIQLMEHRAEVAEVLSALEADPEQDRELLRSLLWKQIVEALPADKSALEYLNILERFPQAKSKTNAQLLEKVRSLVKSGEKTRAAERKKILIRERKKLEAVGIAGTAVVPLLPEDANVGAELAATLEPIKRELAAASNE